MKTKQSLWSIRNYTGNPLNQSNIQVNIISFRKARENFQEGDKITFGLTSDWMRRWRKFFKQISGRNNTKLVQIQFTFDTHVETTSLSPILHFGSDKLLLLMLSSSGAWRQIRLDLKQTLVSLRQTTRFFRPNLAKVFTNTKFFCYQSQV